MDAFPQSWWHWRYTYTFHRLGSLVQFVFGARHDRNSPSKGGNQFHALLAASRELRDAQQELIRALNERLRDPIVVQRILALGTSDKNAEKVRRETWTELVKHLPTTELPRFANILNERMTAAEVNCVVEVNRNLIEEFFPDLFRSRTEIRRASVIEYDQHHRIVCFVIGSGIFIISALLINPNISSLHSFYRDRLAAAFLDSPEDSDTATQGLGKYKTHEKGAPYVLFGGAVSRLRPLAHPTQLEAPFDRYLLSAEYCGSKNLRYLATENVVEEKELTLGDAMAISGAALTPGYFVQHVLTIVMTVLNLRLGKWLPNPGRSHVRIGRPRALMLSWQAFFRPMQDRNHVLVTDGGHAENLGLAELLERRCDIILMSDAGYDPEYSFANFAKLVREYRNEHGIEFFSLDGLQSFKVDSALKPFRPEQPGEARFVCARIRYPSSAEQGTTERKAKWGLLIYIKPTLTGCEDPDVINYYRRSCDFPHEKTADQAFSESQFESYRRLGYCTGVDLCRTWNAREACLWEHTTFDLSVLSHGIAKVPWPLPETSSQPVWEPAKRFPAIPVLLVVPSGNGHRAPNLRDENGTDHQDGHRTYQQLENELESLTREMDLVTPPLESRTQKQWRKRITRLREQVVAARTRCLLSPNQESSLLEGIHKQLEGPIDLWKVSRYRRRV